MRINPDSRPWSRRIDRRKPLLDRRTEARFDRTGGNDLVYSIGRIPQSESPVDDDEYNPPYPVTIVASSGSLMLNCFEVSKLASLLGCERDAQALKQLPSLGQA